MGQVVDIVSRLATRRESQEKNGSGVSEVGYPYSTGELHPRQFDMFRGQGFRSTKLPNIIFAPYDKRPSRQDVEISNYFLSADRSTFRYGELVNKPGDEGSFSHVAAEYKSTPGSDGEQNLGSIKFKGAIILPKMYRDQSIPKSFDNLPSALRNLNLPDDLAGYLAMRIRWLGEPLLQRASRDFGRALQWHFSAFGNNRLHQPFNENLASSKDLPTVLYIFKQGLSWNYKTFKAGTAVAVRNLDHVTSFQPQRPSWAYLQRAVVYAHDVKQG